jgi:hypothetical protein
MKVSIFCVLPFSLMLMSNIETSSKRNVFDISKFDYARLSESILLRVSATI